MKPCPGPDSVYIHDMFDRLAGRYDLFNHFVSLGLDVAWRKEALRPVKNGMRVLDLGCGTGDLALDASKTVGETGEVVGLDFSEAMLAVARKRQEKTQKMLPVRFVLKKAEELPIESKPYDVVISGFVLRNIYQNIDAILDGIWHSLKDGGQISFLDIVEPQKKAKLYLWKIYMGTFAAFWGKMLFGKNYPASYLTESANRFLKPDEFVKKLKEKGFTEIKTRQFMLDSIVLYQGKKPIHLPA